MSDFTNSWAVVIGINDYTNGIPPLTTAVNDARRLADLLEHDHGYRVRCLTSEVTLETLRSLLHTLQTEIGPDDRLLIYFAGHGIALDGDDGPAGYLVPQDARRDDHAGFLSMTELHGLLIALPCRHLLLILDCCFAGAFRWSSTRDLGSLPAVIHRERYERYIQDPAWQVLTSAAYDQKAADVLAGDTIGQRAESAQHSPFAAALFRALQGEADLVPRAKGGQPGGDGVITATELYLYLRECVEDIPERGGHRQTPGLWPLKKHDKGEFILLVPGGRLNLPPAPMLTEKNNPYRGLQSYDEEHAPLFFGRSKFVAALAGRVQAQSLTIVLGASGTGKSSVVKAGLLPFLRGRQPDAWRFLPPFRPGRSPLAALAAMTLPGEASDLNAVAERLQAVITEPDALARRIAASSDVSTALMNPQERLLLVVDQFEELVTQCWDGGERGQFLVQLDRALAACPDRLRIVITLRSDFEPQFAESPLKEEWLAARVVVPTMTLDEYREAIEGPASLKVLYFHGRQSSQAFIARLIGDVANTPGALPLLSFALSELYRRYLERRSDDRALREQDYETLGSVGGSLRNRATKIFDGLEDGHHQASMKRIMLRMISAQGGRLARRRVPRSELVYPCNAENERVELVIQTLSRARLIVEDEEGGVPVVEPAHDALVSGWSRLLEWTREDREHEQLTLRRMLTPAVNDWQERHRRWHGLWHDNPHLPLLQREQRSLDSWLNASEDEFVRRSVTLRRIRRGILAVSLAAVFAGLIIGLLLVRGQLVQTRRELASSDIRRGATELRDNHPATATLHAFRAFQMARTTQFSVAGLVASDPLADLSASARTLLTYLQHSLPPGVVCDEAIGAISYRSDGQAVAVASGNVVRLFHPKTLLLTATIPCTGRVRSVAFGPDPGSLAVLTDSGAVEFWDATLGARRSGPAIPSDIAAIAGSADGTFVAFSKTGKAHVWSRKWDKLKVFDHGAVDHGAVAKAVALSHNGRWLLTASSDRIQLWNVDAGTAAALSNETGFQVTAVAFAGSDPTALALVSLFSTDQSTIQDNESWVRRWKVPGGEPTGDTPVGDSSISSVSFSADGRHMAISQDRLIVGELEESFPAIEFPPDGVTVAAFSPDGEAVATGSASGLCRIWPLGTSARSSEPVQDILSRGVGPVALSADGKFLASATPEVAVYHVPRSLAPGGRAQQEFRSGFTQAQLIAVSESGQKVAAIVSAQKSDSQQIRLWSRPWNDDEALAADTGEVTAIAFSERYRLVVTGHKDGIVRFWNAADLALLRQQGLHQARVTAVAIGAGGQVATADDKGNAYLWNGDTQERLGGPFAHPQPLFSLALDGAGKLLATGSGFQQSGQARVWDLRTGKPVGEPILHDAFVTAVALSRDGRQLATGVSISSPGAASLLDGEAWLWDVPTGELLEIVFPRKVCAIQTLAFDESGRLLTIGRGGGPVGFAVVPIPQPLPDDFELMRTWVASQTGRTVDADGQFRKISFAEWYRNHQAAQAVAESHRGASDPPVQPD